MTLDFTPVTGVFLTQVPPPLPHWKPTPSAHPSLPFRLWHSHQWCVQSFCFRAVWPLLVQLGTDFKCACVLSRFSRVRLFAHSSVRGILQARMLEWVASFLLQGIFQTRGLNPCLLCLLHCRQIPYPLSHLGSLTLSGASLSFWILHLSHKVGVPHTQLWGRNDSSGDSIAGLGLQSLWSLC